jgi:hypothetical protein
VCLATGLHVSNFQLDHTATKDRLQRIVDGTLPRASILAAPWRGVEPRTLAGVLRGAGRAGGGKREGWCAVERCRLARPRLGSVLPLCPAIDPKKEVGERRQSGHAPWTRTRPACARAAPPGRRRQRGGTSGWGQTGGVVYLSFVSVGCLRWCVRWALGRRALVLGPSVWRTPGQDRDARRRKSRSYHHLNLHPLSSMAAALFRGASTPISNPSAWHTTARGWRPHKAPGPTPLSL